MSKKTTKSFDLLTKDQRQEAVKRIIDYFVTEQDIDIGIIAAEEALDSFLETTGLVLFNKGVQETKELVNTRLQQIGFEIDLLIKDN
jgi:uncharacterized protein (DUF2164 family)